MKQALLKKIVEVIDSVLSKADEYFEENKTDDQAKKEAIKKITDKIYSTAVNNESYKTYGLVSFISQVLRYILKGEKNKINELIVQFSKKLANEKEIREAITDIIEGTYFPSIPDEEDTDEDDIDEEDDTDEAEIENEIKEFVSKVKLPEIKEVKPTGNNSDMENEIKEFVSKVKLPEIKEVKPIDNSSENSENNSDAENEIKEFVSKVKLPKIKEIKSDNIDDNK